MEINDDIFCLISFVKDLNYPLVHTMTTEEIIDIFHISNRCFLVCWALKLLDEECYFSLLKDREQDKDLLANLVFQNGFCTIKEKNGFLNGDLSVKKQVEILTRFFFFIKSIKKAAAIETQSPVTLENLAVLVHTNLNIFPAFGDIKTLSKDERQNKLHILEKNKEKTVSTESNHMTELENQNKKVYQINKEKIQSTVLKLEENLYRFQRVIKPLCEKKGYEDKSNYEVSLQSDDLLLKCNKYLKVVTQYFEDLETINTFQVVKNSEPIDNVSLLVGLLAEQIRSASI